MILRVLGVNQALALDGLGSFLGLVREVVCVRAGWSFAGSGSTFQRTSESPCTQTRGSTPTGKSSRTPGAEIN